MEQWVEQQWRLLPRPARRAVIILPCVAVIALCIGFTIDFAGWAAQHPFVTNSISNLVGFCVGVPIVVLVLEWLNASRDAARETQRIERLSAAAWKRFADSVRAFALDDQHLDEVAALKEKVYNTAFELSLMRQKLASRYEDTAAEAYKSRVDQARQQARAMASELGRLAPDVDDRHLWNSVEIDWIFLDDVVKPQRLADDKLRWFATGHYIALKRATALGDTRVLLADLKKYLEWLDNAYGEDLAIKISKSYSRPFYNQSGYDISAAIVQMRILMWAVNGIDLKTFGILPNAVPVDHSVFEGDEAD